ncbi:MarR family transcriptional regulator for hemolysin [Sphingobium wenxiniae]|uniref:MarR family winged helix-turn-helix transcriptional regulator n=1 Tax=Sphingobium wenxiniae (strain DSM 21828 / CGMCC 1.7748 / JZ-1) TaxID=595605 RepID=UPI000875F599|nr:MarR family winged helix-turn-helix transcriptional regulator [Sphingobium wenxiniae]MBB6193552.1 MarR family transcriptional regulator for hemolysin [Sphingobium wenxiniae]SCW94130.1 MarR family transcriptional regulator, transcriptional regulator for hemolysin [Sphingobium faniae]
MSSAKSPPELIAFTNGLQPIKRVWAQAAGVALADFGLPMSLATAVILTSRAGDEGIRQNLLTEEVGVNPGGMVRILDQAEAANLLTRRDSTADRRAKIIVILPEGRALADKMEVAIAALRNQMLDGIPVADVEVATRVLRAFETRIGAFLQQKREHR